MGECFKWRRKTNYFPSGQLSDISRYYCDYSYIRKSSSSSNLKFSLLNLRCHLSVKIMQRLLFKHKTKENNQKAFWDYEILQHNARN